MNRLRRRAPRVEPNDSTELAGLDLSQPPIDRFASEQLDRLLGSLDHLGEVALSRRRSLQIATGIAAGTIVGSRLSPLRRMLGIEAADATSTDGVIVMVYLDGGNDGLNTLVPTTNSLYPTLRRGLTIDAATTRPISADYGLNPALPYVHSQYTAGRVALIRGIGYGPANLSHFVSVDHWHSGFGPAGGPLQAVPHSGWLGRYGDSLASTNPFATATLGTQVPLSMRGLGSSALLIPTLEETLIGSRPNDLNDAWLVSALEQIEAGGTGAGPLANMLASTAVRATRAATGATSTWNDAVGTPISRQLLMAANLINADLGTRVITVGLDGFDTHAGQRPIHTKLLGDLDTALQGFFQRLGANHARRVTVVTYSEFGRRARSNDSDGTDHGTSSLAMVLGANVLGGMYGEDPGLTTLDANGNPLVTTDFRRLYATLLQGWLNTDAGPILGAAHVPIPLFAAAPGIVPGPTTTSTSSTTSTSTSTTTTSTSTTTTTPTTTSPTTTSPTTTTSLPAGSTVPTTGVVTTNGVVTTVVGSTVVTTALGTTVPVSGPTTIPAISTTVPIPLTSRILILGVPLSRRSTRFVVERPAGVAEDWLAISALTQPIGEFISRKVLLGRSAPSGSSAVVNLAMPEAGSYVVRHFTSSNVVMSTVSFVVSD